PAVMKSDGSSAGEGVIPVATPDAARRAYERLNTPVLFRTALTGSLFRGDDNLWRRLAARQRPAVCLQRFIPGWPATATVACWRGAVLDMTTLEVLEVAWPNGPATVVRYIRSPEMEAAVRRIVERLGLSGLHGFDFMLDAQGRASVIEINPRATPTAHLPSNRGRKLLTGLRQAAAGRAANETEGALDSQDGRVVALYPGELRRDPHSAWLMEARHDAPADPALLQLARRPVLRDFLAHRLRIFDAEATA
ncbi:MAG: ATP-grasp domain-containing protein, partial [Caulobacteraceae bacterium]|nr:ATP-grasp domain-containing protein [Caulobacteraceae bacterium]